MLNDKIQPLDIKSFLSQDKYRIPIYQRNYDWGEKQALQLIEDIADYAAIKKDKKYYIGSAVVFARNNGSEEYYETIDGQQRLTTLTILMIVLTQINEVQDKMTWFKEANLSYDHRNEADEAIRLIAKKQLSKHPSANSINEVYRIFSDKLLNKVKDKGIGLPDFVDYLLSNVIIMRIPVPRDTDLNHYFEIMNSRGEQLEKHEVLKASLMNFLESDKLTHCLFNDIWEACSDMNTYVQMKMKPKLRKLLFSDSWTELKFDDFDKLVSEYQKKGIDSTNEQDEYSKSRTLDQLFDDAEKNVKYELPKTDLDKEGGSDRFGSIINFPNFLLQTLKVMYQFEEEKKTDIDEEIKLDDKRLIDIFQTVLRSYNDSDKRGFVKRFALSLLCMRYLFDSYVIKREYINGKDGWSLKTLKKYDDSKVNYVGTFTQDENEDDISKDIRMLEAMFHVSAPTQIYKHWLNAILYYVYGKYKKEKEGLNRSRPMRDSLYTLACTYMLDRYLCEETTEFETIIFKKNLEASNNTIDWQMIDNGCGVENFVFNFYDYVTWKQNPQKYPKFEFTYRTSVEHFYPQHAMDGNPQLDEEDGLNDFGNLCLISRGMNSKFSNNMPKAKLENFGLGTGVHDLSLKLNEMMEVVRKTGKWGPDEIRSFEEKAKERLLEGIQAGCNRTIYVND